jgi:hypothetical protein
MKAWRAPEAYRAAPSSIQKTMIKLFGRSPQMARSGPGEPLIVSMEAGRRRTGNYPTMVQPVAIGKSATSCNLHYASMDTSSSTTGAKDLCIGRSGGARSCGCLNFALHKPANIAHGDGEIVLSLQVDSELRSVAENNGRGAARSQP